MNTVFSDYPLDTVMINLIKLATDKMDAVHHRVKNDVMEEMKI